MQPALAELFWKQRNAPDAPVQVASPKRYANDEVGLVGRYQNWMVYPLSAVAHNSEFEFGSRAIPVERKLALAAATPRAQLATPTWKIVRSTLCAVPVVVAYRGPRGAELMSVICELRPAELIAMELTKKRKRRGRLMVLVSLIHSKGQTLVGQRGE